MTIEETYAMKQRQTIERLLEYKRQCLVDDLEKGVEILLGVNQYGK